MDIEKILTDTYSATTTQIEQWQTYLTLLEKWNHTYNLTAIRTRSEMYVKHLLDSLSITPFITNIDQQILDVGTGAGLPGLILAIYYPHKSFTLVDSIGKKITFLKHARNTLALPNVNIQQIRIEQLQLNVNQQPFDIITSRAFSALDQFVKLTKHLAHPKTRWLAMKGSPTKEELKHCPLPYRLHSLKVPLL